MSDELAFAKLRRAAAGMPHVMEGTSYGTPALKLGKKLFARVKDSSTVVLPCALEDKALLIEAAPDIFFETDHYRGWPLVLARIEAISDEELKHRLEIAWRMLATKGMVEARGSAEPFPLKKRWR